MNSITIVAIVGYIAQASFSIRVIKSYFFAFSSKISYISISLKFIICEKNG